MWPGRARTSSWDALNLACTERVLRLSATGRQVTGVGRGRRDSGDLGTDTSGAGADVAASGPRPLTGDVPNARYLWRSSNGKRRIIEIIKTAT
jgi:hypothetical protein